MNEAAHALEPSEIGAPSTKQDLALDEPMFREFKDGFPEVRPDDQFETGWYVPGVVDPAHYPDKEDQTLRSEKFQELVMQLKGRLGDPSSKDVQPITSTDEPNVGAEAPVGASELEDISPDSAVRIAVKSILSSLRERGGRNEGTQDPTSSL